MNQTQGGRTLTEPGSDRSEAGRQGYLTRIACWGLEEQTRAAFEAHRTMDFQELYPGLSSAEWKEKNEFSRKNWYSAEEQKRAVQFMLWHRRNDGVRCDRTQNPYCERVYLEWTRRANDPIDEVPMLYFELVVDGKKVGARPAFSKGNLMRFAHVQWPNSTIVATPVPPPNKR